MNDHKQYALKVVTNIISVMAQLGAGIKPNKEEIEMIPEELHPEIIAALTAARECRKIAAMAAMARIFPLGEILDGISEQSEED